jgi:hypothetical protein
MTEPVTMSCSGFDPSLVVFSENVNMTVEQASKGAIAHGSASAYQSPLFPCDGSQNTFHLVISADPSGPPFHGGSAVFSASGGVAAGTPCGFGGICSPIESASANVASSLKLN